LNTCRSRGAGTPQLSADQDGCGSCALAGQQTPDGYYNLERMLAAAIQRGAEVGLCGTCMDARAIREEQLIAGARRSNLEELTDWTLWADKVVSL
jgi:uncharacterized protein involved in oxidation of intracellular sulfur